MKFIHKNINRALLLLVAFVAAALAVASLVSVQAFDNLHNAYEEKATEAEELAIALAELEHKTGQIEEKAELNAQREEKLKELLEQEREDNETEDSKTSKTSAPKVGYTTPYRSAYRSSAMYGYAPSARYVI